MHSDHLSSWSGALNGETESISGLNDAYVDIGRVSRSLIALKVESKFLIR